MTDKLLDHLKRALGDDYTIERELTGAGMSRIFVAREHSLGREVVIKVLPKELAAGVNRERFQQEVQLAARLSHPYIVPLLHAGEHEDLLWFTMPFITGESLKFRLEHAGPVPVREVIQFTRDTLEALAYAHSRGVIHRDIKPANILVDGGHAVVTDFGVAKALSAAMPTMGTGHTTTGMAIGTPAYMAPEQLAADPAADHRVDIYAIGLLMYELLAGVSPFSTASPTATMTAQLTRMPDPLDRLRKDIPQSLSKLIMRCLAKSADERPASADEVLKELDKISGELAAAEHGSGAQKSLRRLIPITAIMGLVIVVAAAAMIWWPQHNSTSGNSALTVPPLTPAGATDTGQSSMLPGGAPTTVALKPLTREDSLKIVRDFRDESNASATTSQGKAATTKSAAEIAALDSTVKALSAQMAALQSSMQRPQPPVPTRAGGNTPPPTTVGLGVGFSGQRRGPRKLAILNPQRSVTDTAIRGFSERVAVVLTQQIARNWEVVRRDGRRRNETEDSIPADALMAIVLEPQRNAPDSMELRLTMFNMAGGDPRITAKTLYRPKTPAEFQDLLYTAERWLSDIYNNPGVAWEGSSARGNPGGGTARGGNRGYGFPPGRGGGGRRSQGDSTGRQGGDGPSPRDSGSGGG